MCSIGGREKKKKTSIHFNGVSATLRQLSPLQALRISTIPPSTLLIPKSSASPPSPSPPPPPPSSSSSLSLNRRQLLYQSAAVSLSLFFIVEPVKADEQLSEWERVFLPIDPGVVLLDIAFVSDDPSRGNSFDFKSETSLSLESVTYTNSCLINRLGFLLGTRQTLLETKDGGNTWAPRSIPSAEEEDFNYRFNSISFKSKEGWIIGKPAILLYTADGGENKNRIPLSSQLVVIRSF